MVGRGKVWTTSCKNSCPIHPFSGADVRKTAVAEPLEHSCLDFLGVSGWCTWLTGYQTAAGASGSQHPAEGNSLNSFSLTWSRTPTGGMVIRKVGTLGPVSQGMKGGIGAELEPFLENFRKSQARLSFELKFLPELLGPLSGEGGQSNCTFLTSHKRSFKLLHEQNKFI